MINFYKKVKIIYLGYNLDVRNDEKRPKKHTIDEELVVEGEFVVTEPSSQQLQKCTTKLSTQQSPEPTRMQLAD